MEHSANILRIALVLSIIGHALFLSLSARDLRPTAHGKTMDVEIVTASEIPGAGEPKSDGAGSPSKAEKPDAKPEDRRPEAQPAVPDFKAGAANTPNTQVAQAKPEPKSDTAKTEASKTETTKADAAKTGTPKTESPKAETPKTAPPRAAESKPSVEQKPPQTMDQKPPQPETAQTAAQPQTPAPAATGSQATVEDINRVAAMLGLPFNYDTSSGSQAEPMTKFTAGVSEFKAQVRRCFKLPPGIAANQQMKTVMRIRLKQDGALAEDPELIAAPPPPRGPPLVANATRAVRECAPYRTLPADKYQDWKVLDIDFSPDQMMGS